MIKVIGISDTHGYLPKIEEKFDLLLIGGDVAPNFGYGKRLDAEGQREWFQSDFLNWVSELPFNDKKSKVVFIAGNHDFFLEQESEAYKVGYSSIWTDIIIPASNRVVYLYDEVYTFEKDGEELKIYGTPWCKIFFDWAFMIDDEKLKLAFNNIPEDIDVLLTHDAPAIPPYGIIREGRYTGTDAGNKHLANAIKEKKPKYAFHGHIHSSNHEMTKPDGYESYIACLSINNERYNPTYKPLILEIDGHHE